MQPLKMERGRFAGLLVAQIFLIGITPFLSNSEFGQTLLQVGIFAMVFAGVYAASEHERFLYPSLVLLALVAFSWLGPSVFDPRTEATIRLGSVALSYLLTTYVVIRAVAGHREVTTDTILGGINVFLLIGFSFMFLHGVVITQIPDAYALHGVPINIVDDPSGDRHGMATFFYFSVSTLTTLGFGDIVPTHAVSRLLTSVEAILGQLYVAIFIGRLVGIEVSSHSNRRDD